MEIRGPFNRSLLVAAASVLCGAVAAAGNQCLEADSSGQSPVETTIDLTEDIDASRATHFNCQVTIEGTVRTPASDGTADWKMNSTGRFQFEQRRFPGTASGGYGRRAIRRFEVAGTRSTIAGKETVSTLPASSRLIHVFGGEPGLIQLSPDYRLTRAQLDLLQIPCDPLAASGLLPTRPLTAVGEKWNSDAWVVPMLAGMDVAVRQSAVCRLTALTATEARIGFECTATGAVDASATEITLTGELTFDRTRRCISGLDAVLKEQRTPGPVSSGLDVTWEIHWTQESMTGDSTLATELPETIPDERRLLLTLITPWRIALLHDRDWHVFHETQDMVMLRMVRDGALLAQCNLTLAPQVAAGQFTGEARYLEEVTQALTGRGGRVISSKVVPDRNGWRRHQVTAAGEAGGKVLIWDYVLCTAPGGQQISLVFSHAEEDTPAIAGVIDHMLDSLTLLTNRPKVALPR